MENTIPVKIATTRSLYLKPMENNMTTEIKKTLLETTLHTLLKEKLNEHDVSDETLDLLVESLNIPVTHLIEARVEEFVSGDGELTESNDSPLWLANPIHTETEWETNASTNKVPKVAVEEDTAE